MNKELQEDMNKYQNENWKLEWNKKTIQDMKIKLNENLRRKPKWNNSEESLIPWLDQVENRVSGFDDKGEEFDHWVKENLRSNRRKKPWTEQEVTRTLFKNNNNKNWTYK